MLLDLCRRRVDSVFGKDAASFSSAAALVESAIATFSSSAIAAPSPLVAAAATNATSSIAAAPSQVIAKAADAEPCNTTTSTVTLTSVSAATAIATTPVSLSYVLSLAAAAPSPSALHARQDNFTGSGSSDSDSGIVDSFVNTVKGVAGPAAVSSVFGRDAVTDTLGGIVDTVGRVAQPASICYSHSTALIVYAHSEIITGNSTAPSANPVSGAVTATEQLAGPVVVTVEVAVTPAIRQAEAVTDIVGGVIKTVENVATPIVSTVEAEGVVLRCEDASKDDDDC
ncbi:hypothetical protein EW146_g1501 [Bondarzewia mesenterica]|uniref:Uncharacterized protein n=1 Tax=Bondarzewia mesenterica TaxID=1095465 RepID=A0A4S4M3S5_9AGAM|nr:hypothetical protein EW146_g1501 [Bondarzewia mesenterica]